MKEKMTDPVAEVPPCRSYSRTQASEHMGATQKDSDADPVPGTFRSRD